MRSLPLIVVALGDHLNVKAYACVGGTRISSDLEALEQGVHVVIGTPGRVLDLLQRKALDPRNIMSLVLDEADEMLSRGFKDQIYDIYGFLPQDCQICLFSATMPNEALEITKNFMKKTSKNFGKARRSYSGRYKAVLYKLRKRQLEIRYSL